MGIVHTAMNQMPEGRTYYGKPTTSRIIKLYSYLYLRLLIGALRLWCLPLLCLIYGMIYWPSG